MTDVVDPSAITAASQTLGSLMWLADALRNQGIATSDAPAAISGSAWSRGLTHRSFATKYVSRALAVSPDGQRIAVGTKAGAVKVLQRNVSGAWTEQSWEQAGYPEPRADATGAPEPDASYYAIRGLAFVSNDALIAGFGAGYFRLFLLGSAGDDGPQDKIWFAQRKQEGRSAHFDRCRRLIPLVRNYDPDCRYDHPIAVALTTGRDAHFYYRVSTADGLSGPDHLSKTVPVATHFEKWDAGQRVVGGAWCGQDLWLLSEDGVLASYRPSGPSARTLKRLRRIELAKPHPGATFTDLWGGDDGLAIYAGGHLSLFLPRLGVAAATTHVPHWLDVPGVTDVTVSQPCCAEQRPEPPHPVWMYAVTNDPGLLWIAWQQQKGQPAATTCLRSPFHSIAAIGNRHALHVASAKVGRSKQGDKPATYLVFTTRDERVEVVSFVEMEDTSRALANELPRALDQACGRVALTQGLALWLARRRLYDGFGLDLVHTLRPRSKRDEAVPGRGTSEDELLSIGREDSPPPAWVSKLDAEDLRELARDLARIAGLVSDWTNRIWLFKRWVMLLLHRVTQIDSNQHPALARSLALEILIGIDDVRFEDASQTFEGAGPKRDAELPLRELRAFGEALRKWVVFGENFNAITDRLAEHAEWDRDGRRVIDKIVFATRLLDQRVDLLASSSLSTPDPNPAIWSLARSQRHRLTIQSHTDGRITACGVDGAPLRWTGKHASLTIDPTHTALRRSEGRVSGDQPLYGPMARALSLVEVEGDRLLLVLGMRKEHTRTSPSIHALLLAVEANAGKRMLRIVEETSLSDADTEEVFALIPLLEQPGVPAPWPVSLIAGNAGQPPGLPFAQLNVHHPPGRLVLERDARAVHGPAAQAGDEALRNPAGALAYSHEQGWLFVGQNDGHIQAFSRTTAGAWAALDELDVPRAPAAVRALAVAPSPSSAWRETTAAPRREYLLLAFGAADGTLGLVPIQVAGPARESLPQVMPPVTHTRESSPIRGLCFYRDESARETAEPGESGDPQPGRAPLRGLRGCGASGSGEAPSEPLRLQRLHLMALTQDGAICIYDADLRAYRLGRPSADDLGNELQRYANRRNLAGYRLDHFRLGVAARALSAGWEAPADMSNGDVRHLLPNFVVGTVEGQVRSYELSVPKGTPRRARQARDSRPDFSRMEPITREGIGEELFPRWLRVAPIGTYHLVRHSIWWELWDRANDVYAALGEHDLDAFEHQRKCYQNAVGELAEELYRRRPFSKGPIKIVWEEGAKVLARIGTHAIHCDRPLEESSGGLQRVQLQRTEMLRAFSSLGAALNGLCSQWVGYDRALESHVLIHSFNALMDWQSVVFLSDAEVDSNVRRFVRDELIHRRLFSDDPMVALEALRALNVAMERAIDRALRAVVPQLRSLDFFELIDMVCSFAKKQEAQLTVHQPACTEVARFLALCLFWLPDGVIALGARISEFGLAEPPRRLDRAVLHHARFLQDRFGDEFALPGLDSAARRIDRYEAYLAQRHLPLDGPGLPDPRGDRALGEQFDAILTAACLLEELHGDDAAPQAKLAPLASASEDAFSHSRVALGKLVGFRRSLQEQVKKLRKAAIHDRNPYEAAFYPCDEAERELRKPEAVFEPQRTHYLRIVDKWRAAIEAEQGKLVHLFRIIDRFNRHIYQAAADDLVASLQELAFRAVPMAFSEQADHAPGSLRWLMLQRLDRHPVLMDVYQRGTRLVEYAHLSGTLLAVANDMAYGGSLARRSPHGSVPVSAICTRLHELCFLYGLTLNPPVAGEGQPQAPGSMEIWDTILREWARNVAKYGVLGNRVLHASLSANAGNCTFSMRGDRPFKDALDPSVPQATAEDLQALIDGFSTRERNNLGRGSEQSGGFGLYLLSVLSQWVGIDTTISLADDREPLESPLVLSVRWTSEVEA